MISVLHATRNCPTVTNGSGVRVAVGVRVSVAVRLGVGVELGVRVGDAVDVGDAGTAVLVSAGAAGVAVSVGATTNTTMGVRVEVAGPGMELLERCPGKS